MKLLSKIEHFLDSKDSKCATTKEIVSFIYGNDSVGSRTFGAHVSNIVRVCRGIEKCYFKNDRWYLDVSKMPAGYRKCFTDKGGGCGKVKPLDHFPTAVTTLCRACYRLQREGQLPTKSERLNNIFLRISLFDYNAFKNVDNYV